MFKNIHKPIICLIQLKLSVKFFFLVSFGWAKVGSVFLFVFVLTFIHTHLKPNIFFFRYSNLIWISCDLRRRKSFKKKAKLEKSKKIEEEHRAMCMIVSAVMISIRSCNCVLSSALSSWTKLPLIAQQKNVKICICLRCCSSSHARSHTNPLKIIEKFFFSCTNFHVPIMKGILRLQLKPSATSIRQ